MKKMNNLLKYLFITLIAFGLFTPVKCEENQSQRQQIPQIALSVVFIFGSLLYGGFLRLFSQISYLSYNSLLLISGIIIGWYHTNLWTFFQSAIKLVSNQNPIGLLAIFLPPLIFESAFKLEWHLFKKQSGQTLILGVFCTIISSILIMFALKLFLVQNVYTWTQAFLLACILSCTDIFSFINKLIRIGTPQKIIGLIEGESLFNYCICVMIFQIVNEIIINEKYTYFGIIVLIVQQILGGILFGAISAWIAIYWLRRISFDGVLIITMTIIFCYTIYISAQFTALPISGIIALASFGLIFGAFGRAQLPQAQTEYVDGFWKYLVFVAETNIFLIAGLMVGVNISKIQAVFQTSSITYLFFVYGIVLGARFLSMLPFMKWLPQMGYGMQWKETIILAFGGLKGAIGISFAMIVFENQTAYNLNTRIYFLLHVTTNSIINLLINSVMTTILIKFLDLSIITKVQYKFFKEYLGLFKSKINKKMLEMQSEKFLQSADWSEVTNKVGLNQYTRLQNEIGHIILKSKKKHKTKFENSQLFKLQILLRQFSNKNNANISHKLAESFIEMETAEFDTIAEIRKRFIKSLIAKYREYQSQNNTSPPAVILLLQSAYFDLDTQTQQLESWQWLKNQISQPYIKLLSQIRKNRIIGRVARDYLFNYISYCYDVVSSYIQAQQQVRNKFFQQSSQLLAADNNSLHIILNQSQQNQKQAQAFLKNYLKESFPEIETQVKTKKSSFNLLLYFRDIIDLFYRTGQVDSTEYDKIISLIQQQTLELQLLSPKWQIRNFVDCIRNDEVFGLLPQRILLTIEQNLSQHETYDSNEEIIRQGTIGKYFYFIRRGSCTADFIQDKSIYKVSLDVGGIFGFQSLIAPVYSSTVMAKAMVIVMRVKKICIQKIMDAFPDFQVAFWKKYLFFFFKMYPAEHQILNLLNLNQDKFQQFINEFTLVRLQPGNFEIKQDMIFLRGKAANSEGRNIQQLEILQLSQVSNTNVINIKEKSSLLQGKINDQSLVRLIKSPSRMQSFNTILRKQRSIIGEKIIEEKIEESIYE